MPSHTKDAHKFYEELDLKKSPAERMADLTFKEVERLLNKKNRYRSLWESEVSEFSIKQANIRVLKYFVKRANETGRMNQRYDTAKNILNKLGVIKGSKLLNAGAVLFCNTNLIEVQAAVFAGTDKITFLDIQSFKGDLFELIEKSESYIKEHINWSADLSGGRRIEIPEIPIRAVREAVINSLCHRDYDNPKGNEVAIFKNRLEIYNPGRFPEAYSPNDFIRGNERSILRNNLIANAFYLTSDIERWGSGIKRIYDMCKDAGIKVEFKNLKSGFLVTFYRPKLDAVEQKTKEKTTQKTTQKILDSIKQNSSITRRELSEIVGITEDGIKFHLDQLKKRKLIKRIGPDKGGEWEVL